MVTTRGGENLRRSNRQAGKGWSSLVTKKITKKPKKKSVEKLVKEKSANQVEEQVVDESHKEKEKEMDERGKDDTVQMDEGRIVDEEEEVVESEGEKEAAEDMPVESEGEKEAAEDMPVESQGEKEAAEDMPVESEGEEEDAEELPVESTECDKENAGDDTQVAPQSIEGDTVNASNGGDSAKTTKRTRGKTRMRKLAKDEDAKLEVDFSCLGEHSGAGSTTLSSFLGVLVKEHVSVLLNDWRKLDQQTKDIMWEEIQGRFKVQEEWQKYSLFKQMNCIWRSAKSILVGEVRAASSHAERLALKPSNIPSVTQWNKWVKSKLSTKSKVQS
ncbi:zinc finger CCCH domain-containing protein 13-like [Arabidopsis lyrata subsp. lyrata]|uniref:zinc finger CCCH domain-containing protein 13-like n=1 Tax=Arabidopsis lyrata subsp. lyrata TaxID=81972 RepID=UPI000A29CBF1|nr:zinc finger CCCH domain-containing protein 13-like [Arabidopsis lyrata subsp. lyrata]|eukprot:XP_020879037.1 zinc finger CCCH domain-containing protein 13-like [Arabidopsis lyrata subsp. lyrata]